MAEHNWRLLPQLEASRDVLAANADEGKLLLIDRGYNDTLQQVELLAQRRCECCEGFGHSSGKCPTRERLFLLGSFGGFHGLLIAHASAALLDRPGL